MIEQTARLLTNMVIYYQGNNLLAGTTFENIKSYTVPNHLLEKDPQGIVSEMDYAFRFLPRNASLRSMTEALMPLIQIEL